MSKHRTPSLIELQTWALGEAKRGAIGIRNIRIAAGLWQELGHPEFAVAVLSAIG